MAWTPASARVMTRESWSAGIVKTAPDGAMSVAVNPAVADSPSKNTFRPGAAANVQRSSSPGVRTSPTTVAPNDSGADVTLA
jgi:hypothetical protein